MKQQHRVQYRVQPRAQTEDGVRYTPVTMKCSCGYDDEARDADPTAAKKLANDIGERHRSLASGDAIRALGVKWPDNY